MGIMVRKLTDSSKQLADRFVAGLGGLGDAINTQKAERYHRELARAAEPAPDACYAAAVARANQAATGKAHENTAVDAIRLSAHFGSMTTKESVRARRVHASKLVHTYGKGAPREGEDRSAEFLSMTQIGSSPDSSDPDVQDAMAFIENVVGETLYQTLAVDEHTAGTTSTIPYESARATYAARRSIGLMPFLASKNARLAANTDTPPERDSLYEEVARTYGNEKWRQKLEGYGHGKQPAVEACKLTLLQNKLLLKQVEMMEQGNLALARVILEGASLIRVG